jgi:hypothetical protein
VIGDDPHLPTGGHHCGGADRAFHVLRKNPRCARRDIRGSGRNNRVALGITGAHSDRVPPPVPLPDRDIAFEGDAGASEFTFKSIAEVSAETRKSDLAIERLRREVGE